MHGVGGLVKNTHVFFEDVEVERRSQKSSMARPFLTVLQEKTVPCETRGRALDTQELILFQSLGSQLCLHLSFLHFLKCVNIVFIEF